MNGSACMPSGMLLGLQELTRSRNDAEMMQKRCGSDAEAMQGLMQNMPTAVHEPMHPELCQGRHTGSERIE